MDCNYKGGNNFTEWVFELTHFFNLLPVCPEQLGGLSTPRNPAEIQRGSGSSIWEKEKEEVLNTRNECVTLEFIKGAKETKKIVECLGIQYAILKDKSPSCGVFCVYDGSFSGNIIKGKGIAASVLENCDVYLFSHLYDRDKFISYFLY